MGRHAAGPDLHLSDEALAAAAGYLGAASELMIPADAHRPPDSLPSLSGIGAEVSEYLHGASLARAALSDAAKTAGRAVTDLMSHGDRLDARASNALQRGFAVPRG